MFSSRTNGQTCVLKLSCALLLGAAVFLFVSFASQHVRTLRKKRRKKERKKVFQTQDMHSLWRSCIRSVKQLFEFIFFIFFFIFLSFYSIIILIHSLCSAMRHIHNHCMFENWFTFLEQQQQQRPWRQQRQRQLLRFFLFFAHFHRKEISHVALTHRYGHNLHA